MGGEDLKLCIHNMWWNPVTGLILIAPDGPTLTAYFLDFEDLGIGKIRIGLLPEAIYFIDANPLSIFPTIKFEK